MYKIFKKYSKCQKDIPPPIPERRSSLAHLLDHIIAKKQIRKQTSKEIKQDFINFLDNQPRIL